VSIQGREYQIQMARDAWRELFVRDQGAVLLRADTGTGKTVTGTILCQQVLKHKPMPILFLAHRREIIQQSVKKLREGGLPSGVIMAGELYQPTQPVQVASLQTLDSWVSRGKVELPPAGLVWIDEAHRAMGKTYQDIIAAYQDRGTKILGTTATPIRTDGVGLGQSFDVMIQTHPMSWMIEHGYLVPCKYKVGIVPSLKGVKLTAGDYNQAQLEAVMNQKLLIGDIVKNWLAHARGRPTMIFASGVSHSINIVNQFKEAGIRAAHIDGDTLTDVRDLVAEQLRTGEVEIVSNAQVYIEGTDIPWISCIVFAQPTKSLGRYMQQGGRGTRPWEPTGKRDCLYLDHAAVVHNHGRLEIDRPWELTQGKEMVEAMKQVRDDQRVMMPCAKCGTLHTGLLCPDCGDKYELKGKAKNFIEADLVDLKQADMENLEMAKPNAKPTEIEKHRFFGELLQYAKDRGFSPGWAFYKFQDKFKEKPTWRSDSVPLVPCSDETRKWIAGQAAHKAIAEKYRKAKEARHAS
jgi:DNA repair protein RadD